HTRCYRDWSSDVCSSDLSSSPGLTAWALLGLRAAGRPSAAAYDYLVAHEPDLRTATDIELAVLAEGATGGVSEPLYEKLVALGQIGRASCRERGARSASE